MYEHRVSRVEQDLLNIVRFYEIVPYELLVRLAMNDDGMSEAKARGTIGRMVSSGEMHFMKEKRYVTVSRLESLVPDMQDIMALWVFTDFIRQAKGRFNIGGYPSRLVFNTDVGTCRIVILDSDSHSELKLLKNMKQYKDVTDLIVSPYWEIGEIDEDLFPLNEFYFYRIEMDDPSVKPEMRVRRIEAAEDD